MRLIPQNHVSPTGRMEPRPAPILGFSRKERCEYSLTRALRNMLLVAEGKPPVSSIETEASSALERLLGKPSEGLLVPIADLSWHDRSYQGQRDTMQTGQSTLGGSLVDTEVRSSEFVDALRNRAMISRLGARMFSQLQGNLDIPRQSAESESFWVEEGGTIEESNLTIDIVSMRPKTIASLTSVTRRMLMQGSLDVEGLIRFDMMQQLAIGIDLAAISGSGTNNQPLGILNYPGVNSVSIGANGGAPAWSHLVQLETEIAVDNADGGDCYYLTNARTRGKLKTTAKVTGQDRFLWTDYPNPIAGIEGEPRTIGLVNGHAGAVSNQVPSNGTKGTGTNLSSIIFGDFSQVLIGTWGVLEILPNPYGQGYPSGTVQIRSMIDCDIALRHPESFAVCTDAVTT